MKRYSAAAARQHFSEVLDEAESGHPVEIERRGVRFEVLAKPRKKKKARHRRLFEWVDPLIMSGNWTWDWKPGHLKLVPQKPRKRRK